MSNISEDRNMGRIGIVLKEEYDPEKTYTKLNQVTYSGSSYTLKVAEATGILPTNTDYWICSAKRGDQGEKGDKGDVGPIGPKPVNGTDYNTNAEREEFKNAVVADSKADLEKYITEKETHLDNYTKEKETKLDDYVTDTVKPAIDTYVTDTTKKGIDAYEKEKETALDTYTDTKKTEIDNYVTNTSKPALDQYEKDKEAELETAKNTAISEYDAHAESVLTETNDLFNALDTEKISGTELYIEDAKPCRIMNTEIGGMYKQETTTGANLLDTSDMLFNNGTLEQNGLTAKINTDGSIVINGTATANTYFKKSIKNILEDGNYYFYNFNNVTQSNSTYYMLIQGNKSTGYGSTDYYNARGYQTDNFIKDIITYDRVFDCMFVFINGFVANNLILYPEISKTEQTVFEPYTGGELSPNPNYLQEIEQIKEVKYCGTAKNLLNFNEISGKANNFEYSVNGTYINIKGTSLGTYATSNKMRCHIEKNEVVTIKITSAKSGTYRLWIRNKKNELITNPIICNASASGIKTITVKDNVETVQLIIEHLTSEATYTDTITIQIEKGQNATETEEYKKRTINIDLKGNKLCAASDTIKDKLLIDRNGNVALQKNVEKNIFDGTKKWKKSTYTENTIFYLTNTQKAKFPDVGICNYLPVKKVWNVDILGLELYDLNNIRVGLTRKSEIQTEDAFNEWLTTHNLEVYYALATPELIDLGQLPELLKTFNGINNIWAETNLGNTEIEIEYVQDVKKLLEQQNARLDSIEALLSTTETSALLLDNMQNDLEKEVE